VVEGSSLKHSCEKGLLAAASLGEKKAHVAVKYEETSMGQCTIRSPPVTDVPVCAMTEGKLKEEEAKTMEKGVYSRGEMCRSRGGREEFCCEEAGIFLVDSVTKVGRRSKSVNTDGALLPLDEAKGEGIKPERDLGGDWYKVSYKQLNSDKKGQD